MSDSHGMPNDVNQTPEEVARDRIDDRLRAAGWHVQDRDDVDFSAGLGIAVREYPTDTGPADYVLFCDRRAVGVVEAKPDAWGERITTVEEQSERYANAELKWVSNAEPLPFVYESTGQITRFTNGRDPNPRSREVFAFHQPATLKTGAQARMSFRAGIASLPPLNPAGLRECQFRAITKLEASLKADRPRALVQMATGSGKTYTAITQVYRLLKHAGAERILFLVDTRNLGEQAEQEFMAFLPKDDNRKFTELYNVQRLKSPSIADDVQVVISTIQRMYATLKGEEFDDALEEEHPEERRWRPREPLPVVYNAALPPECFDVVVIDECHRSIYNLWRQVVEYFEAYLIGLTATPDNRTYGFFLKNVVSEYTHEEAVADKVNVGNEIYLIDTLVTQQGGTIEDKQLVEKRQRQTRARRWEVQDERADYTASQLGRSVVNPGQMRTVIRAFRDNWRNIFPGREELPKTLIFAKTDSHADDIIQTVRQEFGEGNEFCRKITNAAKSPKSSLTAFRNDYYPRIAVTVDMIATGTDVKPLECLLFMRDVKSHSYFEQMKGPRHPRSHAGRPPEGNAIRSRKDPLRHRRRRGRDEVDQDRQPAARHEAVDPVQGPGHGADDGRLVRGDGQLAGRAPLAPRQQARRRGPDEDGQAQRHEPEIAPHAAGRRLSGQDATGCVHRASRTPWAPRRSLHPTTSRRRATQPAPN